MLSYQRLSLQSDWLPAVWFIYESHNHICSKWRYLCSKPRRTVAPGFISHHFCFENKMRCKSPLFNRLFDLPTGKSFLMVLDLRHASWPLRKSSMFKTFLQSHIPQLSSLRTSSFFKVYHSAPFRKVPQMTVFIILFFRQRLARWRLLSAVLFS